MQKILQNVWLFLRNFLTFGGIITAVFLLINLLRQCSMSENLELFYKSKLSLFFIPLFLTVVQFIGIQLNVSDYSGFNAMVYMLAGGGVGYIILRTKKE